MKKTLFITIAIFSAMAMQARPILYDWPAEMPDSSDFTVWVDGEELALYNTQPAAVGIFAMSGPVKVKVACMHDVKWATIRPLSLNIPFTRENDTILFSLEKPAKISIEINHEHTRCLYLFASKPENFNGQEKEKGNLYFEPGKVHDAGVIYPKSGQRVIIPGGAIVKGSIFAKEVKNIHVMGNGILDCTGNQELEIEGWDRSIRAMVLYKVKNSSVQGIHIINSLVWTIEPMYAKDLLIDDVSIVNWDFGSDGIDMVGCQDVIIQNCFVRANDDCIVIKSWVNSKYDHDPSKSADVDNIKVKGSSFWNMSWGNALEIGFELRANKIENILFEDCDILHVDRGAAMSIHNGDYATVSNVTYRDIRVEDAQHKLFDVAVFLSQYSLDRPASREARTRRYMHGAWDGVLWVYEGEERKYAKNRGLVKDIRFENISVVAGPLPFSIFSGFDEKNRVRNITIEDFYYQGNKIEHFEEGKINRENTTGIVIR